MFLRNAQRFAACTATLQAIISGTASSGGKLWSRIAPATVQNANPARPDTKAPVKAAALSRSHGTTVMVTALTPLRRIDSMMEIAPGAACPGQITSRELPPAFGLQ